MIGLFFEFFLIFFIFVLLSSALAYSNSNFNMRKVYKKMGRYKKDLGVFDL